MHGCDHRIPRNFYLKGNGLQKRNEWRDERDDLSVLLQCAHLLFLQILQSL